MSDSLKYDFVAIRISTASGVFGFVHLGPLSEWGYTILLYEKGLNKSKVLCGEFDSSWTRESAYTRMKAAFDTITQASRIEKMERDQEASTKFIARPIESMI